MRNDLIEQALPYIAEGKSWRKIAAILGVPRSTLSDNLRAYYKGNTEEMEKAGARVLCFDLETSPAIAAAFGRFKQFLGQDNILSEGGVILCAAYKWLGEEGEPKLLHVTGQSLMDIDDLPVVVRLWELFEEADAVVAHNAKGFDVGMLQARVLHHGLPPLPHVKVLDTLIMAKKNFRLPNNKLDSICAFLGIERKADAGGVLTWLQYMMGDKAAVEHMHTYCLQDVNILEKVYYRLRAFGHAGSEFNAAHYHADEAVRCHVCGAADVHPTGRSTFTAISEFAEMRCKSCQAVSRARKVLNGKEKRSTIVVQPKQ